jgi:hypothetical protein
VLLKYAGDVIESDFYGLEWVKVELESVFDIIELLRELFNF